MKIRKNLKTRIRRVRRILRPVFAILVCLAFFLITVYLPIKV